MEEMAGEPTRDGVPERVVQATIRLLAEQGPSAIKARTVASASGRKRVAGRCYPVRLSRGPPEQAAHMILVKRPKHGLKLSMAVVDVEVASGHRSKGRWRRSRVDC